MKKFFISIFFLFLFPFLVSAVTQSENYKITVDNFGFSGNKGNSENYNLSDTIGEPIIGIGDSENYKTQSGFWYKENVYMSLILDSNNENFGNLIPGTPNTGDTLITITTDCVAGYELLTKQNDQMTHTDTSTKIANYSCNINSPCLWSGVGLGFTITSGTNVDAKWGTSPNFKYAYFPLTETKIHEKTTYSLSGDNTTIGYKIDVPATQKSGTYSNEITYVAMSKL